MFYELGKMSNRYHVQQVRRRCRNGHDKSLHIWFKLYYFLARFELSPNWNLPESKNFEPDPMHWFQSFLQPWPNKKLTYIHWMVLFQQPFHHYLKPSICRNRHGLVFAGYKLFLFSISFTCKLKCPASFGAINENRIWNFQNFVHRKWTGKLFFC